MRSLDLGDAFTPAGLLTAAPEEGPSPSVPESSEYMARASRTLRIVEEKVASEEDRVGRRTLLDFINSVDTETCLNHVAEYRTLIRSNTWPNVPQPHLDADGFLIHFERSALAYVTSAFRALRWLQNPDPLRLCEVHREVLASEALRGQYGKSSPDGLDQRLERCMDELAGYLDDEDQLIVLGSLPLPFRSAESALVHDLRALIKSHPNPPNVDALIEGEAWKFVRRHAQWRIDSLASIYEGMRHHQPDEGEERTRALELTRRRAALIQDLPTRAQELADFLLALNFLNLAMEPAFSFKSGVGLLHGLVFKAAEELGSTPTERQLVLDRNRLFNNH